MNTILVTGANGALGQALVADLQKDPLINVIGLGRISSTSETIALDVTDKVEIAKALDLYRPNLIYHLAATFEHDLKKALEVNTYSSIHFLEAIKNKKLKTRMVLIGSAAEYGAVTPEENPIREDRVLAPISYYGLSKAWQSQLMSKYASEGVNVVLARVFNLSGSYISTRLLAGRLMEQIAQYERKECKQIALGPLSAIRDYISIEEACKQLLAIANHGASGQIYHIASGKPIVVRELILQVLKNHGIDSSKLVEGTHLTNRFGVDVPVMYADISKTSILLKNYSLLC